MAWTTDIAVARVRETAQVPTAGGPSDSRILDILTEELHARCVPALRAVREGYNVSSTTVSLVAGTGSYTIPNDAQYGGLRSIALGLSDGSALPLRQTSAEEWALLSTVQTGRPTRYIVEGDRIHVWSLPTDATETLRLRYYRRLSTLVPVASCFPVATIMSETQLTVTGSPSWSSPARVDIVLADPPFSVLVDRGVATIAGSTLTFSGTDPLALAIAAASDLRPMYVSLHMETCVPQLPPEMHPTFISGAAARILDEDGDMAGHARMMQRADRELQLAIRTLSPRVDGSPKFVVNRSSMLRNGARGRW